MRDGVNSRRRRRRERAARAICDELSLALAVGRGGLLRHGGRACRAVSMAALRLLRPWRLRAAAAALVRVVARAAERAAARCHQRRRRRPAARRHPAGLRALYPRGQPAGDAESGSSAHRAASRPRRRRRRRRTPYDTGDGNQQPWLIPTVLLPLLILLNIGLEHWKTKETSWREFCNAMLARGEVEHLEVDPGAGTVYVYLHKGAVVRPGDRPAEAGPAADPQFYFTIAGIDQFEDRMQRVQKELGIAASGHIPIKYRIGARGGRAAAASSRRPSSSPVDVAGRPRAARHAPATPPAARPRRRAATARSTLAGLARGC